VRLDSHRDAQQLENIHFLMDTCGLSRSQVAHRLGVTEDTIEKKLQREQRARTTRDSSGESPDRFHEGVEPVPEMRVSGEAGGVAPPEEPEGP